MLGGGEVLWTGNKCVKDVAGYSTRDLFIGSEATLGVITKVLLKLIPKPAARRTAFSALARVAPTTIIEDVTVPCSELAGMVRFVAGVARKHRLRVGTFGHMGDGNLHPTFLTDERNADEMHRVEEAFQEIFTESIRLNGTITGEHGIGVAKKKYLPAQAGPTQMRVPRELRKVLDPKGILNPGKVF